MDDFYSNIRSELEKIKFLNFETTNNNINCSPAQLSLLADGLIPVNINYLPTYWVGSPSNDEMPDITDKLGEPIENVRVVINSY